jgi:type IV secretion system protein VirB2
MTAKKDHRATSLYLLFLTLVASLVLLPDLASAAAPFASGGTALSADEQTIVAPIAGIAIIAVGVICWFGKISWFWVAGLVVGIVLVFGNQQIVTWIRGLFSV